MKNNKASSVLTGSGKHISVFIISLLFLGYYLWGVFFKGAEMPLPHVVVALALPVLVLIAWEKRKNNLPIKIGFYVIVINAILTVLLLLGSATGQIVNTGFFEGFQFLIIWVNIFISETIASIAYVVGILKK